MKLFVIIFIIIMTNRVIDSRYIQKDILKLDIAMDKIWGCNEKCNDQDQLLHVLKESHGNDLPKEMLIKYLKDWTEKKESKKKKTG